MEAKKKILVVDDDPNLRKTLSDILGIKGYETVAAANGAEAIAAAEREIFSLVLIDLMLPDMPGLEVMARIKAISPLTEAIILTGHASLDTAVEATKRGAFSYLLKPYQMDDLLLDIRHGVERQHAQAEIHRLGEALRQAHEAIAVVDTDFRFEYVNPAFTQLLGYAIEELAGQTVALIGAPGDAATDPLRAAGITAAQGGFTGETLRRAKDGRLVPVLINVAPIRDEHGRITDYVGTMTDLTERKQAEETLRASLAEKEVLMREIHHRVKNNMQMMSALLELQSGYVKDEQALGYFRDSQQRIQSMAMIHEQLYHNRNLAQIDFAAYLHKLVVNLREQYSERCKQVNIRVDAQSCTLPVDTAIPCGLVLNELVSNAMKHAFPDGRTGELHVNLQCSGEGQLVLEVADDGVGLPPGFDIHRSKGFGLHMTERMVEKQLHGKLAVESNHGTRIVCEIGESK